MLTVFRSLVLASLLAPLLGLAAPARADVTTPDEHLGRTLGGDFTLTDWQETSSYYWKLADESPRVRTERIGETTEGRDFLLTIISSEENLARLDEIRAHARIIADPARRDGPGAGARRRRRPPDPVHLAAMHSTETAAGSWAMEFAHRLATSEDEPWRTRAAASRRLLLPCTNPDGLDHVVELVPQQRRHAVRGAAACSSSTSTTPATTTTATGSC